MKHMIYEWIINALECPEQQLDERRTGILMNVSFKDSKLLVLAVNDWKPIDYDMKKKTATFRVKDKADGMKLHSYMANMYGQQVVHTPSFVSEQVNDINESDYDVSKKRVQKIKKGSTVSFMDHDGNKQNGTYNGMINRGGRSYAKVEIEKKGMVMVPVTQINESINEAEYDYADMFSWVADKMENTNMNIDQMRAAFIKVFGKNSRKYFEAAVDELN